MSLDDAPAILGVESSVSGRRWRPRATDERLALALAQRLGLPEIIGRVLAGRGVSLDTAPNFLNPTLKDHLPDPSLLHDMDVAAERLADAVISGEKIAIFGDYDVDGATSSALLGRYFKALNHEAILYIPDRMREGYGPNGPAMRVLAGRGAKLVVTVDCGTLAYDALNIARDVGLDVIVVDHHLAEPSLPRAVAVINPNRLDESGDYGQLAAVGVAFLLVVATNRALRRRGWFANRTEPNLLQWLDLVALGTVCDVVPLTGLNRVLVAQGLKVLHKRGNVGLAALGDVAGLNEPPGPYHLGFLLGPRVNAGGRVGQADLGVRLLTSHDPAEAEQLARELHRLNAERQVIEAGVLQEAMDEATRAPTGAPLLLVARSGWHAGVIGIVASRLKDAFNRPAIVVALENGVGKGSGRSLPGIDLGAAVTAARQAGLLVNGGGHAMAAGLTVEAARLEELREFLCTRLIPAMAAQPKKLSLGLDGALSLGGASQGLLDLLEHAGPYGAAHPEPRFALTAVRAVNANVVGEKHVRCFLTGGDGSRLKAIAFRSLENGVGEALLQSQGAVLHVAGQLRSDWWQGERRLQFVIDDVAQPRH